MEPEQIDNPIPKVEFISTFEFYSQIIDSLQDYSIFTTDKELRINSWNTGSTKLFGYETEEVIGNHCEIIYTEEDRKNGIPKINIETSLKEGRSADSRWHLHKDGSLVYAYGVIFPLLGTEGELLGFVKILRNLTEKKKSEEAIQKYIKDLEELNTHKENILAILSHDLRSPLTGIIQMAEFLKDNYKTMEEETLKKMLDMQYELSTNELGMLDYLLEWARIKFASEVFTPTQIDLYERVNKVFVTLNEAAAEHSINLQNRIKENTIVFADRKMVLSILQNLVSNAIKYSPKGGKINVTSKKLDHMILVQVKDTGIGMSKQMLEKLFTPQIKRLSKSRVEDKGGGIGLLLVKGFIDKNGGVIWVESIEGKGTSFYFTLPTEKPMEKIDQVDKMEFEESV